MVMVFYRAILAVSRPLSHELYERKAAAARSARPAGLPPGAWMFTCRGSGKELESDPQSPPHFSDFRLENPRIGDLSDGYCIRVHSPLVPHLLKALYVKVAGRSHWETMTLPR
jgi:hypothetical protein